MTEKELASLNRRELLELLLAEVKRNEALAEQNKNLQGKLREMEERISEQTSVAASVERMNETLEMFREKFIDRK